MDLGLSLLRIRVPAVERSCLVLLIVVVRLGLGLIAPGDRRNLCLVQSALGLLVGLKLSETLKLGGFGGIQRRRLLLHGHAVGRRLPRVTAEQSNRTRELILVCDVDNAISLSFAQSHDMMANTLHEGSFRHDQGKVLVLVGRLLSPASVLCPLLGQLPHSRIVFFIDRRVEDMRGCAPK